jgi:hypothetical protein
MPLEIVNKIIMMSRPTYNYMDELKVIISLHKKDDIFSDCSFGFYNSYLIAVDKDLKRVGF